MHLKNRYHHQVSSYQNVFAVNVLTLGPGNLWPAAQVLKTIHNQASHIWGAFILLTNLVGTFPLPKGRNKFPPSVKG